MSGYLKTHHNIFNVFFVIPFYLQSVQVHLVNCVKMYTWCVEEGSVVLFCNW
jgi:hypothetical protein